MSQQTKAMALSWVKIFLAAVISSFLSLVVAGDTILLDVQAWEAILISGLVSVLPVIINWLNPNDTRYGRGSVDSEV